MFQLEWTKTIWAEYSLFILYKQLIDKKILGWFEDVNIKTL